ncbi:MAG: Ig-like domain-containing protein [Roseimicrobium sp.]
MGSIVAADIACGADHCLAITPYDSGVSSSRIFAWGKNSSGQVGDSTTIARNAPLEILYPNGGNWGLIIDADAGDNHSIITNYDPVWVSGSGFAWGANGSRQVAPGYSPSYSSTPQQTSGEFKVFAGANFSGTLVRDSGITIWGGNEYGQHGIGTTTGVSGSQSFLPFLGVSSISAGSGHVVALKFDGTAFSWGNSAKGQVGEGVGTQPDIASAPVFCSALTLLPTGQLVSITSPSSGTNVPLYGQQSVEVQIGSGVGTPASVSLYHKGVLLDTDSSPPFSFNFDAWTWGRFELTAVAQDSLGLAWAPTSSVVLNALFDSDSDGFSDYLEWEWFGNLDSDIYADFDGDGISNYDELLYGTDPMDPLNGISPELQLTGGDGQTGTCEVIFGSFLRVHVRKATDLSPFNNAPVTFTVNSGDVLLSADSSAWFSETTVRANSDGDVGIWVLAGQTPGPVSITATCGTETVHFTLAVTSDPDSDGDGMASLWEWTYGLNPTDASDKWIDMDADRIPNFIEYLRGATHPQVREDRVTADAVVDPVLGSASPSDNIYSTLQQAYDAVSVDWAVIEVKGGMYTAGLDGSTTPKRVAWLADTTREDVIVHGQGGFGIKLSHEALLDGFIIASPAGATSTGPGLIVGKHSSLSSPPEIRVLNSIIRGRVTNSGTGVGGVLNDGASLQFFQSTAFANSGTVADGIRTTGNGSTLLVNSIVWNDVTSNATDLVQTSGSNTTVVRSIVRGGAFSGIDEDPMLTPVARLTASSGPVLTYAGGDSKVWTDMHGVWRQAFNPWSGFGPTIGPEEWSEGDADGLPEWWEGRYFVGYPLTLSEGANDDPDRDGFTNQYEYAHGTSPVEHDYSETPEVEVVSGNEQSAAKGQVFARTLKVQVKTSGGVPIPYGKVAFAVDAGDSLLSANGGTGWHGSVNLLTDADGYAEAWLFAGQTLGAVDIIASAGGDSTEFDATVTEVADSPSVPLHPGSGYIIGNQSRTGSLTPVPASGTWNVATTAQGFAGTSESVYWLPTQIGRSAVLEWIPDASALQGVGDVSGIMMRLSDEVTADQPFVFAGVRQTAPAPTAAYAVELAWRSTEGATLRRIADLELPGGAFAEGMRFRLELVGGRVLLSCARPASPGFEPWQQRLAVDLGEEAIWKNETVPAVFAGMAFASGSVSSTAFVIGEHETRLEADRPGVRWWRVLEPAQESPSTPEWFRLGTQGQSTQFFADVDLVHEGLLSEPDEAVFWHPDYWHGEVTNGQPALASLTLNSIHPVPMEHVDVYWKAGPVDDDDIGSDTASPDVVIYGESSSVPLNDAPAVGGGPEENGTWVYLGRLPGNAPTYEAAQQNLIFTFDWALQASGSTGSLSKLTFDGLLLVGGSTQPDANGNQIADSSPEDSSLSFLGDWYGDGWTDSQEYYLGTDAQWANTGLASSLTIAAFETPNPLPLPRGRLSSMPLSVKVTYDSAGTKPVKGYGMKFSYSGSPKVLGFAGEQGQFPSWSELTVRTNDSGLAQSYVWSAPDCPIPAGAGTYQVLANSEGGYVYFTVKPYDNHAPLAIDATSQSMALARTSTFPFATNGNALAASGSWLASGDTGGITNLLPQLPNITMPSLEASVILWRWNSYSGGAWEATQYLTPDSSSDDSFGALIAMDSNPDPAMKASAMMAVAAPEQGKVYLYALSQDGAAWRRWPSANAVIETGGTNISSIALQGRWLAVGDATASSGRGKVDVFRFASSVSGGNVTWTLPSTPTGGTLNPGGSGTQDAFGTSVSLSETGHRLVVGAPSNRDPADPGVTGLAVPSVYVYEPASGGTSWQQITPTIQNDGSLATGQDWSDWARFGGAVLAVGDHVVVGSPISNGALTRTTDLYLTLGQPDGAVVAYKRNGSAWETSGVHIEPYLTFGWRLARGTGLVYAAAKTLEVYMVGGSVVVTSAEDSDPLDPLSAFVQTFGFDTNDDLAEIPGGEIFPGSLYPDDVPLAADATSVFVLHSNAESGPDAFAEYRWLPEVSRSAALNTTVAELSVQDLDWNNLSSTPFENISLNILTTPTPWSLAGPTNGVWDLRVGSTSLLAASPPGLAFVELEAIDVAGELHAELVALKLDSSTLATPEILSGKWLSPTFVELAWSPAAADTESYQFETAVLDGSPSPTFDQVAQIDGAVDMYQFEVVAEPDGYQIRVRARRGDDVTAYSDIFNLPYDSDSDGLPDWWEQMMGDDLDPLDDPDGDGWDNAAEFAHGTNPYAADSDGDGIPDDDDAEPLNRNSNVPGLVIHTVLEH